MAKLYDRELFNSEDVEFMAIESAGDKPETIYFFPVITFIVLLYFNRAGIELDGGYISAMLGVAIVSTLVQTWLIGFGLITNEWYSISARSRTVLGEIGIGVISLLSSQFTFFVIGFEDYWLPTAENVKWFVWGFIIFQIMWITFTYFYNYRGGWVRDTRVNVFMGMFTTIAIGILGVYVIIGA